MIYQNDNFLSQEDCSALIEMIEGDGIEETSPIVFNIKQQIADYLSFDLEYGEELYHQTIQIDTEDSHYYFLYDDFNQNCLASGNRFRTVLIYLNSTDSKIEFVNNKIQLQSERGRLINFHNIANGEIDTNSIHKHIGPTEGKQYILVSHWRTKKYDPEQDKKLYDDYLEKGYKCSTNSPNSYFIVPQNQNTKEIAFEYNKMVQLLPPHTVHQLPAIAKFLSHSVIKNLLDIYQEKLRFYGLGEYKTYYEGETIELLPKHKIPNIITLLLVVSNNPTFNHPWPFYLKYKGNKPERLFVEEGMMLIYDNNNVSISMPEAFKGKEFTTLDIHYQLKV